jgi:hypothetical protein
MQKISKSTELLANLDASDEFKSQAARMGIGCLKDVLDQDVRQLKAHPLFTYLWYTELLNVLKREGLLDEFQDKLSG